MKKLSREFLNSLGFLIAIAGAALLVIGLAAPIAYPGEPVKLDNSSSMIVKVTEIAPVQGKYVIEGYSVMKFPYRVTSVNFSFSSADVVSVDQYSALGPDSYSWQVLSASTTLEGVVHVNGILEYPFKVDAAQLYKIQTKWKKFSEKAIITGIIIGMSGAALMAATAKKEGPTYVG